MGKANQGKWAEALVRKELDLLATSSHFAFEKLADAFGGFMRAAICDFLVLNSGHLTLLEVKEVEHKYRLPKANYATDQRARQKIWELAGGSAWVLIAFKELRVGRSLADAKMWRAVRTRTLPELGPGQGSWLFESEPLTLKEAMKLILENKA